jgi:colanic acid/amylovoran/stewartan biosynthesis glycosyltransferase WcaL/AmsK/CpsK
MRLLYVVGRFPKVSETFVYNEALAQLDRGHDLRVVSVRPPEEMGLPDEERARAVTVTLPTLPFARPRPLGVPEDRVSRRAYAVAAAGWIRAHALSGFAPDVIHAHFVNLPTLIAGNLGALLGVPYTFMAHSGDYMLKMSDDLLRARVLHADAGFVISHVALAELRERARLDDDEAQRLSVVRAAMAPRLAPERADDDGTRPFTMASVARLVPMKGLDTAVAAFARVRAELPEARYVVVGDGPERAALEAQAAALGVADAIAFEGVRDNVTAQALLAAADVAVLPCRRDSEGNRDGIPVSLMEAGHLGVPVVSTPLSGVPELVEDGVGGLLVPPDDPVALASALLRLARDDAQRERYGRALQARVRDEFGIDRQLDRLHDVWGRLIRDRDREPVPC